MSTHNEEQLLATDAAEEALSRRSLFKSGAMMIGGAFLSTTLLNALAAHAQDGAMNGTAMNGAIMIPGEAANNKLRFKKPKSTSAANNDIAILNFALTLEYLEADFYTRVVEANAQRRFLSDRVTQAAETLRNDEVVHVQAILSIIPQLGGTPVDKPTFQFPAESFMVEAAFLAFSATLEVTGTGAYLGQAPKVKSKDVLKFAASVYGVEARHTGLIRYLGAGPFSPADVEMPLTMQEVIMRVTPYIASGNPFATPAMTNQMTPAPM